MINLIISSQVLAKMLQGIDFDNDVVRSCYCGDHTFTIVYYSAKSEKDERVSHYAYTQKADEIDQQDRRWDWIKDIVTKIPDIPLVMEISIGKININISC
jgi:hypothetical protein